MSEMSQMISNYKEIRHRLRNPPNAVIDSGINLHPIRIPPLPPFEAEVVQPCYVTVVEIPTTPLPVVRWIVPIRVIERAVCEHFHTTKLGILSHVRLKRLSYPRHICHYLVCTHTNYSLPRIGQMYDRDHTTIMYGHHKIARLILTDKSTAMIVKVIESVIFKGYSEQQNNHAESAVAAVAECDLAQEQDSGVPQPEICAVD